MGAKRKKEPVALQELDDSLHMAAMDGDLSEVNRLLAAGVSHETFDEIGYTPLHHAVAREDFDIVDCLLRAGADVNAHDERVIGNTPLSAPAERCSLKMAKRLIEAGADPTIRGWMQLNAIDRAARRTDPQAKKVQTLLRKAAEPHKAKSN